MDIINHNIMEQTQYLVDEYSKRIFKILDNEECPLYLREHYAESPSWYTNHSVNGIVDTLIWMSYSDNEKLKILDEELQSLRKDTDDADDADDAEDSHSDRSDYSDYTDYTDYSDRSEYSDRSHRSDRSDRGDRSDRNDKDISK